MRKNGSKTTDKLMHVLGVIIALLLWQIWAFYSPSPVITKLEDVLTITLRQLGMLSFWNDIFISVSLFFVGYLLSIVSGVMLATILFNWKPFRQMFDWLFTGLRSVSAVSVLPVLLVLLGTEKAKVATVIWTAAPVIIANTLYGYSTTDQEYIEAAMLDGASDWRIFWNIRLPLATGTIIHGMKMGLMTSWVALITAETIGSTQGLGHAIIIKTQTFRYAEVYLYIATIAIIAVAGIRTLEKISRRKNEEKDNRNSVNSHVAARGM